MHCGMQVGQGSRDVISSGLYSLLLLERLMRH